MTRWEYAVITMHDQDRLVLRMNELGDRGWELVQFERAHGSIYLYCKRPLPDAPQQAEEDA